MEVQQFLIDKANAVASSEFMNFPDYDKDDPITDLPGALAVLLNEHLDDVPLSEVYDFFRALFPDEPTANVDLTVSAENGTVLEFERPAPMTHEYAKDILINAFDTVQKFWWSLDETQDNKMSENYPFDYDFAAMCNQVRSWKENGDTPKPVPNALARPTDTVVKEFPNGFTEWQETHFHMVTAINENPECAKVKARMEAQGLGGMWELAEELTDKFEHQYKGVIWDGDHDDTIELFLQYELKQ